MIGSGIFGLAMVCSAVSLSHAYPSSSSAPCPVMQTDDRLLCELSISELWELCQLCKVCPEQSEVDNNRMNLLIIKRLSDIPKSSESRLILKDALNDIQKNAAYACTNGNCSAVGRDRHLRFEKSDENTGNCSI
jgi:hypothetical protein